MSRRPVILCVDDEALVLDSIREQLRRHFDARFRIEVAQEPDEALEIITDLEVDGLDLPVLVSDHIMPRMKGDQLLIEVHRRQPHTRKILLTGQASVDAVGRLVNHGALYRYIAKPWARDDLMLTIQGAARAYFHEKQVEAQRVELERTHAASRRFVPFEFLRLLGREHLADVSLNDHVSEQLSVYFSDIRSFTRLVEGKTPKQAFDFINEYLGHMEPAITGEGGFIDGFTGDGIMALFKASADHAVRAGIASLRALDAFNRALVARGEQPIRIGIGINTGPLMLGIRGGRERLNAGVIGDPVNLASRLEAYTKDVGASLLISEHTVAQLADPAAYSLRHVDRVRFKGKSVPVSVYEVLDGLPPAERAAKLATRAYLEASRAALLERRLGEAIDRLRAALALDPHDPLLVRCLACSEELRARGFPDGWDGVTNLVSK